MDEAKQQISNTINNIEEDTIPGSPRLQIASIATADERLSSPSVFNITDRLPFFSYLVNSNRIRWYRVIMRYFLQCHRELHRYQLTAQEQRDAVCPAFDAQYTLDQCQNDLAAVKECRNVTRI